MNVAPKQKRTPSRSVLEHLTLDERKARYLTDEIKLSMSLGIIPPPETDDESGVTA